MDTVTTPKLKDGFLGQRMIVIPKNIIARIKENMLIHNLYFTDIGYFPKAANHSVKRKNGSKQYILLYCFNGEGTVEIDQQVITLKANSYFIIELGKSHHYYAHSKDPWSIYWIHFTGFNAQYFYNKFLAAYTGTAPLVAQDAIRTAIFEELLTIAEDGYSETSLEYANISLWQLLKSFLYDTNFSLGIKRGPDNKGIDAAINYMKDHLDKPLKIDDIAAFFNYSPSHFFSLFKNYTGYPPINYFNHLKMQKACQYLSFTTMNIKEISYTVGFSDPFYFSRLFKKLMGISPQNYRREYKQQ